jgi:transposase
MKRNHDSPIISTTFSTWGNSGIEPDKGTVRPLLDARKAIERQVGDLDRKVHKLARHDVQVRRLMTVPGVGPITALCFKTTVDDPTRFKRSNMAR